MFEGQPKKEPSQEEGGKINPFEKVTPDQIRDKIKDPNDPIHNLIKGTVRSFIASNGTLYRDETFAEDLAQEVSLKVWKNADSFQGNSALKTWIFKIAQNAFFDQVKKKKRREAKTDSLEEITEKNGHDLPESRLSPTESEMVSRMDSRTMLDSLKGAITLDELELLKMKFAEGMTYKSIAKKLKMPIGTVKSGIARLLGKIRSDEVTKKADRKIFH